MSVVAIPGPGFELAHYRLLERLGRGGMGEVWLAQDTQLPRRVAIKLLAPHLIDDREAVERLLREAKAAASVDHPGVVTVYDAGIAAGRPYLVMQRVEGDTLEQALARGPFEPREAVAITDRLADALAEVHALGIVHRDLKPSNVVLTPRGPKMLDFGIASVRGLTRLTTTGSLLGTPMAVSPEQLRGLPPDNRADLWALGVMLYRMLTGRPPFVGDTFEAIGHAVLNATVPPPSSLHAGIGADLDYIALKLLRKDPGHRYARAEELLADLRSCEACLLETPAPNVAAPATVPRLAVMYFEVMSQDPDDEFLAAGLTEDLIIDLTRLEGVRVATRAEVAEFRSRSVPPRTLGRELDAEYVLLGSVRRAGQRARISAQLVRASDGHALWADRFDRTIEDLFDTQAEVSRRIVEALQLRLGPEEQAMIARAPTRSNEAYTMWLRARDLLDSTPEDSQRAEALLRQAIALDPEFALAHATLGECLAFRAMHWWAGREIIELAEPAAKRALELDPDLPEAQLVMSMIHRLRGDIEALTAALARLMQLEPDHPEALEFVAWSYLTLGRPLDAIPIYDRLIRHAPSRTTPYSFMVAAYELLGQDEEASRWTERMIEVHLDHQRRHPDDARARTSLALGLIRQGRIEEALAQAERALALAPTDGRNHYNVACVYARAGLVDRALEQLRTGLSGVQHYLADWPARDPDLRALQGHPEFERMFPTTG